MTEVPRAAAGRAAEPEVAAETGLLPRSWVRTGPRVALTWSVSRVLMMAIFLATSTYIIGDVTYYWRKLEAMSSVGLANTLSEYPTPVVWILELPHLVTFHHSYGYLVAFIVSMAALDGWLLWLLWHAAGRRRNAGVDFWIVFSWLIGMLIYVRFDMIPAVLVGAALVWVIRRPGAAGAVVGLGAAVKLWPALLFPALLSIRDRGRAAGPADGSHGFRGPFTLGFVIVGFGLALISLVTGGLRRLFSPLTWQSDRGLQIESLWATPLMLARVFSPSSWQVDLSKYQAYEVFGPGVSGWLTVSTVITVLGILAIVVLVIKAFRHPDPQVWEVALLALAVVLIMIVTNKTLSPQYVLWLGGPVAVLLITARTDGDRRVARRLAWSTFAIALLTQLIFPQGYNWLLGYRGHFATTLIATLVLTLRNLALLAVTGWVVGLAFTRLRGVDAVAANLTGPR